MNEQNLLALEEIFKSLKCYFLHSVIFKVLKTIGVCFCFCFFSRSAEQAVVRLEAGM